jgi:hypothetical protein
MTVTEPLNRDNPSQRRHRGGRQPGHVNYLNDILINIMESLLPNGTKAWCLVPLAYKDESGEDAVRDEDDIHKTGLGSFVITLRNQLEQQVRKKTTFCCALRSRRASSAKLILAFLEPHLVKMIIWMMMRLLMEIMRLY